MGHISIWHCAVAYNLPEFGVEDGDNITHDTAISLLRKKLPHGIT